MILKTKILLLAILPLLLVAAVITYITLTQARMLSEEEIRTFEEHLLASKRAELRNYINLAQAAIAHVQEGADTQEQAKDRVKTVLHELTYGEDAYFFVYDADGVNLVHPAQPELVGRDLYDMKDLKGDPVIRNLLAKAQAGGGFHRYVWRKPSEDGLEDKLSYVVQLPQWGWMIGTGLYIDDVAQEVAKARAEVTRNIRNTFLTVLVIVAITVILIALSGIAINMRELRMADSRLQALANRSVRFQVSERRRFARELHDGISQMMVSVKFRIESAQDKLLRSKDGADRDLEKASEVLNGALREVRRVSHDLRPSILDDLGLAPALNSLTEDFSERCAIDVDLDLQLTERLPEDVEITLYRVVQEALTNVERHAGAGRVRLKVWRRSQMVYMELTDDGCGFTASKPRAETGIGLRNMRERVALLGGEFAIQADDGQGTRIHACLPIRHDVPNDLDNL